MAMTSVAIAPRSAAYLAASWSTICATLRTPSQSCSTSTAISSGASTRSGGRMTQPCRVSSNFSLACRGNTGRLASLTLMLRLREPAIGLPSGCLGNKRPRRHMPIYIGMIQRVELNPKHIGLEQQRIADRFALRRRLRVLLDELECEVGVARRLLHAPAEIAHDVWIDEIIMRQHAGDALFVQVRREQFRQRRGDGFERGLVADEMHIGFDRKARRGKNALGGFHIGAVEPKPFGQFQPALDAAFGAEVTVMILDPMPPFEPDAAIAEARDHHGVLDRYRALVIIAVQRPGLHLALVQFAAMQQPVKRMQIVIAGGTDVAQRRLQLVGIVERCALAERKGRHPVQGHGVHSVISVPSAGDWSTTRRTPLRFPP